VAASGMLDLIPMKVSRCVLIMQRFSISLEQLGLTAGDAVDHSRYLSSTQGVCLAFSLLTVVEIVNLLKAVASHRASSR
jgi:hypothetical protein